MIDCIFGIKCNGVSISVTQISIDEDQSKFDYICNVSLRDSWNGNGAYDVSIINKDYIQGIPVSKWKISKAWISYNWGTSFAKLIMEDEEGNETCDIIADDQSGSVKGFHVPSLARTIFTKAQEIARDYPNAKVCNAVIQYEKSRKEFDVSYFKKRYKEVSNGTDEEYISFIEYATDEISKFLKLYKEVKDILSEYDDQRSKMCLKNITSGCKKLLNGLKDYNN